MILLIVGILTISLLAVWFECGVLSIGIALLAPLIYALSLGILRRFLIPTLALVFSFVVLELCFLAIEERTIQAPFSYEVKGNCVQKSAFLPHWNRANSSCLISKYDGEDAVFEDSRFSFGTLGERICPELNGDPSTHVLLLGGSNTFGEGLDDTETLGCQLQRAGSGKIRTMNLAKLGFGPGEMYRVLSRFQWQRHLSSSNGAAFYLFIDDHIPRTVGSFKKIVWTDMNRERFFFRLGDDGSVEEFTVGESLVASLLQVVGRRAIEYSTVGRYFIPRIDFLFVDQLTAARTSAHVISLLKKIYEERTHGKFSLVFWPRQRLPEATHQMFLHELKSLDVPVIEIPPLPLERGSPILHESDNHPSALEVEWVAQQLHRYVPL